MYWKRSNPNCNGNRRDKVVPRTTCIKISNWRLWKYGQVAGGVQTIETTVFWDHIHFTPCQSTFHFFVGLIC